MNIRNCCQTAILSASTSPIQSGQSQSPDPHILPSSESPTAVKVASSPTSSLRRWHSAAKSGSSI